MSTFNKICARIAANDPDLRDPELLWFGANDEQAIQLASALITNTFLESLQVSVRHIHIESARELARALCANKTIRMLLIDCQGNGECARELIRVLEKNITISSLTLVIRDCTDAIRAVERAIMTSKTLRTITLDTVYQRVDGVISAIRANMTVAKPLTPPATITSLKLSNCLFNYSALFDILGAQNTTIEQLYLSDILICDKGMREIARILLTNATLTSLSLLGAGIMQQGAREIARTLRINRTLRRLNLSRCRICDDGIIAIANALTDANRTLEILRVSNCCITPVGIGAIARMLRANTTLATLDISKNDIGQPEAIMLEDALEINSTLRLVLVHESYSSRACGSQTWILQEAFISAAREQRRKEGLRAIVRATRDPHSPLSILPGDGVILRDICGMCKVSPIKIVHR
jgi:Ran GTPase-activating protein (RanGAP) involved in mRNA processing and transport